MNGYLRWVAYIPLLICWCYYFVYFIIHFRAYLESLIIHRYNDDDVLNFDRKDYSDEVLICGRLLELITLRDLYFNYLVYSSLYGVINISALLLLFV